MHTYIKWFIVCLQNCLDGGNNNCLFEMREYLNFVVVAVVNIDATI